MHLLCPRLQRQDRTEPGSQEIIPGQPSLPGNRQDLWGLQGLRDRSRCSAEAWWRRFAGKYAVAVAFVGARKGPDRIAPHSGYNCSACLTGRTSCSLATTLGCSTPEGRLGTPRYQARELLIGIILRSRAASRERASNPIRRRSSRSAEGDAAAGWPIRNTGDPNSDGEHRATRYQARELLVVIILHSWPYPRERASIPISASPAPATPTQPPVRTRGRFGPRFWARGTRATRQHPSCISVQHPRARAISRPIPGLCTKVQHEAR
jgi:hypothetical protein